MKIERLRTLRERKGLTQGQAAKKMGIVRTTYSNYEAGNREPDLETVTKMAEFFEVSVDYLLGGDAKPRTINNQPKNVIMEAYDRLPHEKQKLIDGMIKALSEEQTKT